MERRIEVNNITVLHNETLRATVKGDRTRTRSLCIDVKLESLPIQYNYQHFGRGWNEKVV